MLNKINCTQRHEFENIVYKMVATLFKLQYVQSISLRSKHKYERFHEGSMVSLQSHESQFILSL